MNSIRVSSLVLFLVILIFAVFLGGREINTRIEEVIKNNYQTEIDALKQKLDKHSELINSIMGLGNDDAENGNNESVNAGAENESSASMFEYIKENGGITITKYIGRQTSVQIPEKIEQLPVLKIGENAFADTKVKSVTLPSSCTEIDWFAFYGCYALSTVYILSDVEVIGYGAFDSCAKSLTIYCENGSYAQRYAQSFGISYSIIK